ncbi:MAG: T9SS type A sorting domain-containing protein [Calditrichales bacterium]|nr:MAG: T9SS type A sorting domain-containing protein [Calditrichales bacterium]
MTADEVKSVLTNTAIQDNRTGAVPNYNWGYGKMDILQAFVSQAVSDTVVTRSILSYENLISGPYFSLSGTNKMAVRYKAPHGGKISGAILTTLIHNTTVNPIISGTGNLLVAVHEDNGGIPGARIGQQVSHPLVMLDPGTENYINMLPTGVSTTTDQFYHVVFGLSNPADEVKIKFDSGSLDRPDNHSFISEAGVWKTMSERFGNPYNLLFKSEITSLDYLNSINEELVQTVRSFALDQNYPNPFNPSTKIRYHLVKNGPVELSVFDVLGRKVMTLIDENKIAGDYTVEWTGRNSEGNLMPSGVYFY